MPLSHPASPASSTHRAPWAILFVYEHAKLGFRRYEQDYYQSMTLDDAIAAERMRIKREHDTSTAAEARRVIDQQKYESVRDEFIVRARTKLKMLPAGFWEHRRGTKYRWKPIGVSGWMLKYNVALLEDGRLVNGLEVDHNSNLRAGETYHWGPSPARTIALNVAVNSGENRPNHLNTDYEVREAPSPTVWATHANLLEYPAGVNRENFWPSLFAHILVNGNHAGESYR